MSFWAKQPIVRAADHIAREYKIEGGPLTILENWTVRRIMLTAKILQVGNDEARKVIAQKNVGKDRIEKKKFEMEAKRAAMLERVRTGQHLAPVIGKV